MRQLKLPFDTFIPIGWWRKSSLWKNHYLVSTVQRPCEDEALGNVYYASKMIDISAISELSGLERRIFMLELRSMLPDVLPRWYQEQDRHQWIAKQSNMPISDIKSILDSVSYRLRISA